MKVLILSYFYSPDLSAGSFRMTALVKELDQRMPPDAQIDVITTLPNRYATFTVDVPREERHGRVRVHRIALPGHRSGMVDQSRAYMSFALAAARIASGARYDLVFATSSKLMTAVLGAWIARRQRTTLYLDIRDIFVDTIEDVISGLPVRLLRPLLVRLERFAVTSAQRVNLVSEGFAPYFRARYPHQSFTFITNGIDDEFVELNRTLAGASSPPASGEIRVLYAGNMGEGQGLQDIIPELARRLGGRARFRLIGDGGRRARLESAVAGLPNVELVPPMNRAGIVAEYGAADVLFLHLNDYEAFKKVLPSKVFEYAASGKPVWAGVGGYSAQFLAEHVENATVFPPCDAEAAVRAFDALDLRWRARADFVKRFARRETSRALADSVLETLGND